MIYPEGDVLKERVRNRYSLVVLASKRAKQIKEGAPVLIDTSSTNHLTIALEEIAAGKVSFSEHTEVMEDDESPALAPAISFGIAEDQTGLGSDIGGATGTAFDTLVGELDEQTARDADEFEVNDLNNEPNAVQSVTAAEEA